MGDSVERLSSLYNDKSLLVNKGRALNFTLAGLSALSPIES